MNANEHIPKTNPRLNRIRTVSRFTRWIFFLFFINMVWFFFQPVAFNFWSNYKATHSISEAIFPRNLHFRKLLEWIYPIFVAVWYWKLVQLFRFYERGLIFAAETIQTLKILGVLCAVGSIISSIIRLINKLYFPPQPHLLSPGTTVSAVKVFKLGFFSFDFGTGIDFGVLMAGVLIVIIAWIMDEGRKIQEEQELTV